MFSCSPSCNKKLIEIVLFQNPELTNIGDWPSLDKNGHPKPPKPVTNSHSSARGGSGQESATNGEAAASTNNHNNNDNNNGDTKTEAAARKTAAASASNDAQSGTSDEHVANQENHRPNNQYNGERKKSTRKKWVPLHIDVRTSRGGRRERPVSQRGGGGGGGGSSSRPARPRDPTREYPEENWRTERRPFKGTSSTSSRGRPSSAGGVSTTSASAAYPRRLPRRTMAAGAQGAATFVPGAKKFDPTKLVNGQPTAQIDLKNGPPIFYAHHNYNGPDPQLFIKECIKNQM